MSVVYEAWDKERNARVAVKTLPGLDPRALYRFKNEFRFLANVSHPNMATLYELFFEEDQCFFTMEYVPGAHFLEYVRPGDAAQADGESPLHRSEVTMELDNTPAPPLHARRGILPGTCNIDRLTACLAQLTRAVMALHGAGILHRDLKPLNVKVTPEGRVVVLDFGLAAHTDAALFDSGSRGDVVGTIAYMSPEQSAGGDVSEATDWYAVGVMVYEALTGRLPFDGNFTDILVGKREKEAPRPRNYERVSEMWDDIRAGLLARDPASRMAGEEVLALLEPAPPRGSGAAAATARSAPARPERAERIFVGREAQLALLREAFTAAPHAPSFVFVRGKSGIGKSSMIERFLREPAADSNLVLLAGRCYERESMPYKSLDSVIDALARYLEALPRHEAAEFAPRGAAALAQVFPVLRRVPAIASAPRAAHALDQHELRRRAFYALRDLLARLGDRRRVVIWVDDLQWGDVDSAALLREVLSPPDAPAFLFIGSYRSEYEDRSPSLKTLLAAIPRGPDIDFRDVLVGPLNPEETLLLASRLLEERGRERPMRKERAREIARDSEGSPYLLQEIASVSDSSPELNETDTAYTIDSVLHHRVAALPEDLRLLLETVAVSVRPLGESEILRASGVATHDPGLLVALRSARLIRGAGAEIEPYHDRVRETVLAHLEPAALAECHGRLALLLEDLIRDEGKADAEAAAAHFEGAGNRDKASRFYVMAAERASATLAFKNAADLYQRCALDLSGLLGQQRCPLLVRMAEALGNAGRGPEAARAYHQAARYAKEPEVFELERNEARWFASSGHMDEGRESLEKVLRRVNVRVPGRLWRLPAIVYYEVRLLVKGLKVRTQPEGSISRAQLDRIDVLWDTIRSFGMVDVFATIYLSNRCLLLALQAKERHRIARSLAFAATGLSGLGWTLARERAAKMIAVCAALNAEERNSYSHGMRLIGEGMNRFLIGGFAESLGLLQEAERTFSEECSGVAWELATTRIFSLWNLLYLGRFNELARRAELAAEEGADRGDLYQAVSIGSGHLPVCHLTADRSQAALEAMESWLNRWTWRTYNVQLVVAVYIRVWIHLYRGDAGAAWDLIEREWAAAGSNHYLSLSGTRQWLRSARAQAALAMAVTAADPRALLRTAEREAQLLEGDSTRFAHALAGLVRAGCAAVRGESALAAALLEKAANDCEKTEMFAIAACAQRRLGGASMERADVFMAAEGIVNPARFAAIFVNGFPSA